MPTYDYTCRDCGQHYDVRMSISAYSATARPACTACGSTNVARRFATVNVLTGSRGSGGSVGSAGCGTGGFT